MTNPITREELRCALHSLAVVDALPPAPYGQRHLPGAIDVVAEDSDEHIAGVLPDKAAAIVTYSTDAGCTRGPALATRLQALGYTDVWWAPPGRAVELRRMAFATSGTCRCTSCPCTSAAPCARRGSAATLPRHDR
jgi:hypothetical protein